jgi:hypothetical protein
MNDYQYQDWKYNRKVHKMDVIGWFADSERERTLFGISAGTIGASIVLAARSHLAAKTAALFDD